MSFAILPLLSQAATPTGLVHDGGVCAGLSWVTLAPGEQVARERGPDFDVFRFHGPAGEDDHWWGVYSGNFAQAQADGPSLISRDGVTVRRAVEASKFAGYLAERQGWQNHFFGSIFDGSPKDVAFFARIDFGPKGQALCKAASQNAQALNTDLPAQQAPHSPIDVVQSFVQLASADPDRAIDLLATGSVFYLGDYAGPTSRQDLVARVGACRATSMETVGPATDRFKVSWLCPSRSNSPSTKRILTITLTTDRTIVGGDGGYTEITSQ